SPKLSVLRKSPDDSGERIGPMPRAPMTTTLFQPTMEIAGDASPGRETRRAWNSEAIRRIEADYNRSADTHLILQTFLAHPNITIYFKDESSHPTGSLKHRLARSLFLYALSNDWIGPDTTVIEA